MTNRPILNDGPVVVLGGAGGIGAAVCRKLAATGRSVVIGWRSRPERAEALASELRGRGVGAFAAQADATDGAAIAGLFARCAQELGAATGLAVCSGLSGGRRSLLELTDDVIEQVLQVNAQGALVACREALAAMSLSRGGRGGSVVLLSTAAVRTGGRALAHYVAAKAAVEALPRALAWEYGAAGLRLNAVCPGAIATEMNNPEELAKAGAGAPLGRVGEAEEVAEAIAWLLSDAASYVTATALDVSGGR